MSRLEVKFVAPFFVAFLWLGQSSFAQSPVTLTGSIGGGFLSPQSSNLKGDITSIYDYPLSKTGYDIHGKVRIGVPVLPFAIVGSISYNSLSDNAVLPVTTTNGIVNSKYTSSLSIFGAGLGIEYALLPAPVVKPYIAASAMMNFFSGSGSYDNNIIPEPKLNSASRFGLDLGVGAEIEVPVLPVSFEVAATYRMANLSGKAFGTSGGTNGFGGIPQTTSYDLNDAKNPADPNDHNRSISYLTITVSMNFNLL